MNGTARQDPTATQEQEATGNSREQTGDVSILGQKSEGEVLRNVINKLSDERNLRDHAVPHVCRTVQEEDDSPGHSWKMVRYLPSCGEDMSFLYLNKTET